MNLIMKDYNRKMQNLDSKKEIEDILIKLLIAFGIFITVAVGFTIMSLKEAHGSVTAAVYDNIMTDEMAEYIAKHPGVYEETDMQ